MFEKEEKQCLIDENARLKCENAELRKRLEDAKQFAPPEKGVMIVSSGRSTRVYVDGHMLDRVRSLKFNAHTMSIPTMELDLFA
jgi:regulator of replication initiation timing